MDWGVDVGVDTEEEVVIKETEERENINVEDEVEEDSDVNED